MKIKMMSYTLQLLIRTGNKFEPEVIELTENEKPMNESIRQDYDVMETH